MLYGTGALRLDEKTGKVHRVHALKYTIKDGVVYDSQKLLGEVREMVRESKKEHPNVKMPFIPMAEGE
jgi:imidazolonepropionase